jgi:hypothetical protein
MKLIDWNKPVNDVEAIVMMLISILLAVICVVCLQSTIKIT